MALEPRRSLERYHGHARRGRCVAKALFLSLPLHGHVNPSLSLVRELVARGDEVIYYGTERFAEEITRTGAHYRPYRDAYLADLTRLPAQTNELSWLLMCTAASVLQTELDGFRAERPDYVVSDSVAPWGH